MQQAILNIALPNSRIPVPPSQLKIGHEYLHLSVGGFQKPEPIRVKISNIRDQPFGDGYIRIVAFHPVEHEWKGLATFPFTDESDLYKYNSASDIFFKLDPMNRRGPLLMHRLHAEMGNNNYMGGRRKTKRRHRKNRTRK